MNKIIVNTKATKSHNPHSGGNPQNGGKGKRTGESAWSRLQTAFAISAGGFIPRRKDWRKFRYPSTLLALLLLLAACQSVPTFTPTPTASLPPTGTASPTATASSTPTPTILPTFTPEPAWYQPLDPSTALKYNYAQVTNAKAKVYISLEDAVAASGNYGYLPNFPAYVAYTTKKTEAGLNYYLTNLGWMKGEDLQELTPSTFTGLLLTREITFRFGWALTETQSVNTAGSPVQSYTRYQVVYEVPTANLKPGYVAIGADEWLPEDSVRLVGPGVPEDAGESCRFIYVDLTAQTLRVYNECKLVFVTLISSGQDEGWTFPGRFAVLFKVAYNTISPPQGSTSKYYIEGVPYFMTYYGDLGFHGAYWHDAFGAAASHGCINLSPADSQWLYTWAWEGDRVIISAGE